MKRLAWTAAWALALTLPASALHASGDYGCYPDWSLFNRNFACSNTAVMAPGNDSRVNLFFLLRDKQGAGSADLSYPTGDWDSAINAHNFFAWEGLRGAFYPRQGGEEERYGDHYGSRCVSLASGETDFRAALAASRKLPAGERERLNAARSLLTQRCSSTDAGFSPAWPDDIKSAPGKEFLAYLRASEAFYAGRWDETRQGFAALRSSRDRWLAEVAAYMLPRAELNAAQETTFDDYGYFDGPKSVDREALDRAEAGFRDYLKRYGQGRYAASAQGLLRRLLWLGEDAQGLAREYERLLAATPAGQEKAADLVEEIDNKLLIPANWNGYGKGAIDGPMLLATIDLMMMRESADAERPVISEAQLAAQEASFAGRSDLFSFVQANHAFYVRKDMRKVLQLIPDDARRPHFSPLQFSRQVLRGMALAALKDRNEAGFWREMIGGAKDLYQRPVVELALAMNYERSGKLADVFAQGSSIQESSIREILLVNVAGPDLLRAQAKAEDRPRHERDVALFTLLYRQLGHGDYTGFVRDVGMAPTDRGEGGVWDLQRQEQVPVGLFRAGTWSDGYACPALTSTAVTLSRNPRDARARLCLGEFYRLNGFDYYGDDQRNDYAEFPGVARADRLGGTATLFPGRLVQRGALYAAVIADPAAPPGDKAYALYRAVNCYAPNGNNTCGGTAVEQSQRQAWFQRLKRDYPGSEWAKKLRYYW